MDATDVEELKRPRDLHWPRFVRMFSSPYTATFYATTKYKINDEKMKSEWSLSCPWFLFWLYLFNAFLWA